MELSAKISSVEPDRSNPPAAGEVPKPKKKICCACPETKLARDECVVANGEDACALLVEAHKVCLRAEGFNV
jgi:cytochrome c oxidase assembly protein subunit 17